MNRMKYVISSSVIAGLLMLAVGTSRAQDATPAAPEKAQIVVVIDVSASMKQHVFGTNLPKEVADIQAQIEVIQQGDTFKKFMDNNLQAQTTPDIKAAQAAMSDAFSAVDQWLTDHNYGQNTGVAARRLADLAISFGCDSLAKPYRNASVASSSANGLSLVDGACAKKSVTLTKDQRDQLKAVIAYLDDNDYKALVAAAKKAQSDYLTKLTSTMSSGAISDLMKDPDFQKYVQLIGQRENLAKQYKVPTRLDLAKLAVSTLLDLSRLEKEAGQRDTSIGLVTFSNDAYLVEPMTDDYDTLQAQVDAIDAESETNIGAGMQIALQEFKDHGDPQVPGALLLLSDGQTNIGQPSDLILSTGADAAKQANARICTVGIGNSEAEIDAKLLKGLADNTGGEYLFAKTGEELVGFLVSCRQSVLANVLQQYSGTLTASGSTDVGSASVPNGSPQVQFALHSQDGKVTLALTDPQGKVVDSLYPGAQIVQGTHTQMVVIDNPPAGDWKLSVDAADVPDTGTFYGVVVSAKKGASIIPALPEIAQTGNSSSPASTNLPLILGGVAVCLFLLVAGAVGVVVVLMRRNKGKIQPPPAS